MFWAEWDRDGQRILCNVSIARENEKCKIIEKINGCSQGGHAE